MLRDEIAARGPISFARFMVVALYSPGLGYYEQPDGPTGRRGDFLTSVSVGGLFGELLAFRFADWLVAIPGSERQIVEAGAHDGTLARDILTWLQTHRPALAATVEYWIIEPSQRRRESQERTLANFAHRVKWFGSWEEVPTTGVRGVIFANELLDAMPVRRIGWDAAAGRWFEWGVAVSGGDFVWTRMPAPDSDEDEGHCGWPDLPRELLAALPNGFTTEVCPAAVQWWSSAARALRAGRLITLDYGLTTEQFFEPERKNGTLRAFFRHHQVADLLARPGEQDLTAHVNFTAIQKAGEAAGLQTGELTTQERFLTGIVRDALPTPELHPWITTRTRQFQTLTHPEHLGQSFRVLWQTRA